MVLSAVGKHSNCSATHPSINYIYRLRKIQVELCFAFTSSEFTEFKYVMNSDETKVKYQSICNLLSLYSV